MSKFFRTALIAVLSLGFAATLSGTGAATAFGAALVPGEDNGVLLPQSVREAAQDEAESATDYTIVPEANEDAAPSRAASLAAMVAQRAATETASREEECLAGAVYFESRSEPLEGQLAVAQVILNRASSGRFPASLCGVVFQPSQFSFVRGSGMPPIARNSQDWREAVAVARIARDGAWNSRAEKALFFHASRVSPGWHLARVAAIGNHVFYR
jgi:N-acetylmuramoyl-L-alanine amidase